MSASLSGLQVLVTRPAAQAEGLCQRLLDAGASVQRLPLLAIEPLPAEDVGMDDLLQPLPDACLFTSRNAVEAALRLHRGPWPRRCYAVGAATAEALVAQGHPCITPPQIYTSEGLLALPDLQQVRGQRWLIVTGADGRDVLASTLAQRGAELAVAIVYRRAPITYAPDTVSAALEQCRAAIVTSGEALRQLWQLTPADAMRRLQQLCLVLPSARVVELARSLGFQTPLLPEQISDAAFVRCLEQWWTTQGKE